jgi:peptidylprolyl isomerase
MKPVIPKWRYDWIIFDRARPCRVNGTKRAMNSQQNSTPLAEAQPGNAVRVHFVCKLADGSVFASTRERQPKAFVLGASEVIPGMQEAVVGMKTGESKTVTVPPERAYGPYHEAMTAWIERALVPADLKLEIGVSIRVKHANGKESDAFVTEIRDDKIKVDGNHPLAGKALTLELELVEISPA